MAHAIEGWGSEYNLRHVTTRDVDWFVSAPVLPTQPEWKFWDIWQEGRVDPYTLDIIERFAKPGTTVVDVGAWCGPMTLWAAHCGARVVAVEPDPIAQRHLHFNVLHNDYTSVEIFDGAVADYTGTTHIAADPAGWGSSMSRIGDHGNEVPCLTLPDLFDIYDIENCSLVKMDCEGAECMILEHGAPFLAKMGVPLLCAMHQPFWGRPLLPEWLEDFGSIEGELGGFADVLALP